MKLLSLKLRQNILVIRFTLEYTAAPFDDPIFNFGILLYYTMEYTDGQWHFLDFKSPIREFCSHANDSAAS